VCFLIFLIEEYSHNRKLTIIHSKVNMELSVVVHAVIPALRGLRKEDCEFEASLGNSETLSQKRKI
jgi:hypothetical protein